MKKLALATGAALLLSLSLSSPVFAAPTWVPVYKPSQNYYVSPDLSLPNIENKLVEAAKANNIKFVSIATVKGDDLPNTKYAQALNDRFISMYGSQLGDNYITLVYVRDIDPKHGSFSMNAGSNLRDKFPATVLQDFQKPVLKRFLPQNPTGAIVQLTKDLNDKVSSDLAASRFIFGFIVFVIILVLGGGVTLVILIRLEDQKNLKAGWKQIDEDIKKTSESFVRLADEIKFFDAALLDTSDKKTLFESIQSSALNISDAIEILYSKREEFKKQNFENLETLRDRVTSINNSIVSALDSLDSIKNPRKKTTTSYRNVYTQDYTEIPKPTPKATPKSTPKPTYKTTSTPKSSTSSSTNVYVENNYWGSSNYGNSGSSGSSSKSDDSSSSSSSYDWSSSSSSDYGSSDSSSYDSSSSDSSSSSSDW